MAYTSSPKQGFKAGCLWTTGMCTPELSGGSRVFFKDVDGEIILNDLAELDFFSVRTVYSKVFSTLLPQGEKDGSVFF